MKPKLICTFLCTVCLLIFALQPAAAQQDGVLEILGNEVVVDFPDTVTFKLTLPDTAVVERAVLVYGTVGLTCQDGGARQLIDLEDQEGATIEWQWELDRSGAIPPGATVWWQWELRTAAGELITIDRAESEIIDRGPNWQTLHNDHVTVHWFQGGTAFGQAMLDEADQSLTRIAADFGVEPLKNVEMWVYPSSQAVRNAILNVPEWTGGVAFPEYGIVVLGVGENELDWAKQIVPHELAHLVVGERVFNCRGINLPTWLSEGLARYAEPTISEAALQVMEDAFTAEKVPSLRSLSNGFSAYSNAATLSYTQSYLVVAYMIETFGAAQMNQLLTMIGEGALVETALETVYGFDTEGLDVAWRTERGFAPTATPESDGIALQATATPIATLSLGGVPVAQPSATPSPTVTSTATAVPAEAVIPTVTSNPSPTAEATLIAAVDATETDSVSAEASSQTLPIEMETEQPPWLLWGSIMALLLILPLLYLFFKRS